MLFSTSVLERRTSLDPEMLSELRRRPPPGAFLDKENRPDLANVQIGIKEANLKEAKERLIEFFLISSAN